MEKRYIRIICFVSIFLLVTSRPSKDEKSEKSKHGATKEYLKNGQCFYEVCDLGKPDMVNVHLVAHSHNDLGYKKTVDQYYYGSLDYIIQPGAVQYILDTALMALEQNPARRFVHAETGFLVRWWNQQDNVTKELFKTMVNDGRMELTMGGWGSNDEGAPHYVGMVDQMALGLKFLKDTFGKCGVPKVAWQVDQFGHSREQTSLFAMMGFDGLFIGRMSYQDKEVRIRDKTLEHMWFGSANLGDQSSLFTGIMYNKYETPLDLLPFEPVMDDPRLEDYNVPLRVSLIINKMTEWSNYYSTNHVMLMLGGDFEFSNAHRHFKNADKLLYYVNLEQQNGSNINMIMSTPSCYLYALNQVNQTYTSKTDDFMPLEDNPGTVWSGYFTSRTTAKRYERTSSSFLQACKQLNTMAQLDQSDRVQKLAEEVAIMQHHDAATGTCREHVAKDYNMRLHRGNVACQKVAHDAYQTLLPWNSSIIAQPPDWQFCDLLNVTYCSLTENNQQFTVLLYNPYGQEVTPWIRVPVTGSAYLIIDSDLVNVDTQVVPITAETLAIPDREGSIATDELVFQASIPPLGFSTYFVEQQAVSFKDTIPDDNKETLETKADTVLENEYLSVTFDEVTGRLKSLTNKEKSLTVPVDQNLKYYMAMGNPGPISSVYKFIPDGDDTYQIGTGSVTTSLVQGSEVQEFRQVYSPWASQVFRLYTGERHLEIEWTIGPIPNDDDVGKEVISLFTTDLETNELYNTDSNGREILQRRRNFQPTWNLTVNSIAVNYYPVNTRIYIQDEARDAQLTVVTDRSHGGSSLNDGEVEIMLTRRLTADGSGVDGEIFDEPGITGEGIVARGKMYILLDSISDSAQHHRDLAQRLFSETQLSFAEQMLPPAEYVRNFRTQWSPLTSAVPPNVHLMTLETYYENQILIRLEHFYENDEDNVLSQDATVVLQGLFTPFTITSVEELTLGANKPLATSTRLQWNVEGFGRTAADMSQFVTPVDPVALEVVLKPMQIRTFMLNVQYN